MDRDGARAAGDGPALQPGQARLAVDRIARALTAAEEALDRGELDRATHMTAAAADLLAMLARGGLLPAERASRAVTGALNDLQARVARLRAQLTQRVTSCEADLDAHRSHSQLAGTFGVARNPGGSRLDCSG